ncbi:hypothetical protein BASA60_001072 [Batrachochytrium salamandrivorans]|nr:hypothetical protein BASA60_001072 [Batrachochytrium salamandrivorans]
MFDPLSLRTIQDVEGSTADSGLRDSPDDAVLVSEVDSSDDEDSSKKSKKRQDLNPTFTFSFTGSLPVSSSQGWDFSSSRQALAARASLKSQGKTSIDDKITKSLSTIDQDISSSAHALLEEDPDVPARDLDAGSVSDASQEEDMSESHALSNIKHQLDEDEPQDLVRDKRKAEYFDLNEDTSATLDATESFQSLQLSRPILKSLAALGYVKPTEIQARAIPLALQGRDICGSAVTGSGKTAAFIVPIIERLLFRPKNEATTRVLVLVPTRELGVQCQSVAANISKFTDISICLCVGGMPTKIQEAELRLRPDIVIATPGRLIDHIHNSQSFSLDAVEILVIDEADRILDDGFEAELNEIIKHTPRTRQTMLFSATMTDNIDDLIKLSLNRPVRLFVDRSTSLANRLVQEFIRVRGHKETSRPAILAALCSRTYTAETISFSERLEALELFKEKKVSFLLATDLASRGLDISDVKTVINYDMPKNYSIYIHRVGRTARGERSGRAVSLIGEADRALLKLAIKNTRDAVKNRVVPSNVVEKYEDIIAQLKDAIRDIYLQEKEEKEFSVAEREINRTQNIIDHHDEILSRPARTWFQTEKERNNAKATGLETESPAPRSVKGMKRSVDTEPPKRNSTDGLSRKKRRLREAREEDKQVIANARKSVKSAKASVRPQKISHANTGVGKDARTNGKKSSFSKEIRGRGGKSK